MSGNIIELTNYLILF